MMEHVIDLKELFPASTRKSRTKEGLHFKNMNREAAAQIAAHLGLSFIDQPLDTANVCQANAHDVRPEYRTAVTAGEIFRYLIAVLNDNPEGQDVIPYPSDPESFWALARVY